MSEVVEFKRAIQYRLYPTDEQVNRMAQTFGCARKVFNMGLELENGLYAAQMGSLSKDAVNDYCNHHWKQEMPWLKEVDKFALTNSIYHLDAARKNFFEGRAGPPKFKSRKDKQSYTTNYTNNNIEVIPVFRWEHGKKTKRGFVKLPKIGMVPAIIHRRPEDGWTLKSATITKTPSGEYYASVLYSFVKEIPDVDPQSGTVYGLDYSSPHFAVDSYGEAIDPPKWFREAEKRLAKEQRKLSRMTPGSNNYQKQRLVVARIHEHIANQRKDYTHKLSREIANSCTVVCVEDLDLSAMKQSLNFGKATSDAGFGDFRTRLQYKLEEQGRYFVKIDKWYPSSKTCNYCGGYNGDLKLGEETWICSKCHRLIRRDPNAALNIRDEGLRMLLESLAAEDSVPVQEQQSSASDGSDSTHSQNRSEHRG